jgi:hypothetical protein
VTPPVHHHTRTAATVIVWLCLLLLLGPRPVAAQQPRVPIEARHATTSPKIDGTLDDEVWSGPPMVGDGWVSYNPLRGEAASERTHVWIAYDERALYFAFRCFDPEPDRIRATVSRRDTVFNDDWVAVSLDSTGAGQQSYHMFVNPAGIQMDALNSSATGEDFSPDWRWESAARIDAQGYTVEIRVPLESIRFKGGDHVGMRVLFFRRNSRLGLSWSWPEIAPGKWVFESNAPVEFAALHAPRVLEMIPAVTASQNAQRSDSGWTSASARDLGASVKYGLSSTVTLDATVNPDFSQVESDAFQIQVNQRFPIFYAEKRPFFMEGLGLLNLAGTGGDATMQTAVDTRNIVQPSAGAKVTGSAGQYSFALLSSGDKSYTDAEKLFTIARGVRNLGQGQYVGALVTDTEHLGAHNRVVVGDLAMRHGDRFTWNGYLMYTDSADVDGVRTHGAGAELSYSYNTRRLTISGQAEHYDRGFRMDTAFINRVGVTTGWQYGEVQFYPTGRAGWIKRVAPFVWGTAAEDRIQGGPEHFAIAGLRMNFTRQGNLRVDMGGGQQTFAGRQFDTGRVHVDAGAQLTKWLNLSASSQQGAAIYYDPDAPYQGYSHTYSANLAFQPSAKLSDSIGYSYASFDRAGTGERIYAVHVVNMNNVYQFTPQFLVRAIMQLDTSRRQIFGNFLASYELTPGTVVYLGYTSTLERPFYQPYQSMQHGFFFKASYLARL